MDAGITPKGFSLEGHTRNSTMGNWMREEGKGHLLLNV